MHRDHIPLFLTNNQEDNGHHVALPAFQYYQRYSTSILLGGYPTHSLNSPYRAVQALDSVSCFETLNPNPAGERL